MKAFTTAWNGTQIDTVTYFSIICNLAGEVIVYQDSRPLILPSVCWRINAFPGFPPKFFMIMTYRNESNFFTYEILVYLIYVMFKTSFC